MGHDEDKNNFNGGANLVPPASTASGSNPTVSVNPSPSPISSTNNPSSNPMIPVIPNPRAQFTSGNRLGMRQSRTFSAQEELNRISNDLSPNSTNPTAPVGDIILGGEKPKKNKKPLIFALVGVAIVAVIGVVAALLLKNGNIIKSPEMVLREKFNLYANYMLYGEDSTTDIKDKEYSPGNTYQLGKIQSSLSDKESTNKALDEYFTKAEEKFSNFYDEYKKNNIIKLNKILSDHGDNLDMLHYELLAPSLNGRAIMSFYANNKKNTDFIDQYFTVHRKSQNQKTIDKANDYKNKVTNFINLLARYDQYKCFNVKNEIVNSSCLVSRDKNFMLLRKEYEEYISYFSDNVIKNSKLVDEIFASIWRVKEVLYEK